MRPLEEIFHHIAWGAKHRKYPERPDKAKFITNQFHRAIKELSSMKGETPTITRSLWYWTDGEDVEWLAVFESRKNEEKNKKTDPRLTNVM